MTTWHFPKEVWMIIKRYENDLIYPEKRKKYMIKQFIYHLHMPFSLGMHEHKKFENQYDFLKYRNESTKHLWYVYPDELIRIKIEKVLKECRKIYY